MPTTFANTIDGNDIYAKRAEQDKDGNQIDTTYAKSAGLAAVATSGSYNDLSNTPTIPDGVPTVTSSDDGKVLKASYSGGQGSYSWQTESGGGGSVNDVEVNGSSVVNAQGVAEITVPAQEQANWTEADNTDPSYIQNKPTEKNLVAGSGISISTSSNSVTIAADETVLWSGTYSGTIGSDNYITLSEAASNFEIIEITNGGNYKSKYRFDGNSTIWSFMQTYANTTETVVYSNRYSITENGTRVTCQCSNSFNVYANAISYWTNRPAMDYGETQLTKIVGIKRISS